MNSRSEEKVLCPWCGAEMSDGWHENGLGRFGNYLCQECFAKSPDVAWPIGLPKDQFDILNKAAALRRYTPPIKPMTLEEIKQVRYEETAFWIEFESSYKAEPACHWYLWSGLRGYSAHVVGYCEPWHLPVCDYGRTWRCWERRPTDEERNAAEWET